ncbi:unnamed protein product [Coffea canephora]|uniref:Uncharacterized protein n=1 Tax=Coffea canephora TaxID=49390 RepID=A0A068TZE2_COFCA|nr:unnamed protein product [Coffea canephora]
MNLGLPSLILSIGLQLFSFFFFLGNIYSSYELMIIDLCFNFTLLKEILALSSLFMIMIVNF